MENHSFDELLDISPREKGSRLFLRMNTSYEAQPPGVSDDELLEKFYQGDNGAFLRLYVRYAPRVELYIKKIARDSPESKDIFQTVWMKMYHIRGWKEKVRNFEIVLFRIARNETFTYLREHLKREEVFKERFATSHSDEASAALEQSELKQLLDEALGTLALSLREVIVLKEQNGMSVAEIATVTGATDNLVRVRYHRAKHLLRKYIVEKLRLTDGEHPLTMI